VGSSLAWLDNSRDDQQRMRELIGLFSEKESLDELGIGQVRDAFSDLLFPGTSSLHTRARYLVIVPWCFQAAERQGRTGVAMTSQVETNERTVIATLKKAGVSEGLIGSRAGVAVKTLPSTIYWTALAKYGIRYGDQAGSWLAQASVANVEAEELAERPVGMWHPTVPQRPKGFPYDVPGGLDLAESEARWLRDRILAGTAGSMLAHMLSYGHYPVGDSTTPWEDPAIADAPYEASAILRHAQLFSLAMHGAALLYNLLVRERYEREGLTQVEEPVADYRARLADWVEDAANRAGDFATWDRADMWARVTAQNPRIADNQMMRRFVNGWLDAVANGAAYSAADDDRLRAAVGQREKLVKRAQSRLVSERMIRTWSGASGSRRLTFRWPNVRRLLTDIHDGLGVGTGDAPA
jgi:transposase